ncbi:hypothetical protein PWT90_09816 [Aphanocladium album]|nr:hypothetical protein PWT90_09816 [Aphanocladium album]
MGFRRNCFFSASLNPLLGVVGEDTTVMFAAIAHIITHSMMRFLTLAAKLLLAAGTANALLPGQRLGMGRPPPESVEGPTPADANADDGAPSLQKRFTMLGDHTVYWNWFEQLLDHSKPELGTFKQLYYWSAGNYAGPGSPIIMNSPGENNATAFRFYATNGTLPGTFAQEVGGATILLEHRFWGYSSPYANLTTDNLQLLTLDQHMQDLVYFANNVNFYFDPTNSSRPDKAPWVLTGCSYSGAVTAWLHNLYPGTYWAYHASSAVVESISNFWQYFQSTHDVMPKNCSTDYSRIITYVDKVLATGTEAKKQNLKKKFGFGILNDHDFAWALQDGLYGSQYLAFSNQKYGVTDPLHQFCDYIENRWNNSTTPQPGPEGVGLCPALNGLAKWYKEKDLVDGCSGWGYPQWTSKDDVRCYINDDFNSPIYRDTRVDNMQNRQWQWMLCNEPFEWWRTGAAPAGQPRMSSKLISPDDFRNQCALYFPEVNGAKVGVKNGRTSDAINALTGGWNNVNTTRLMWSNGENDPWRPATVSSPWRPGGMLASTPEAPVHVIPNAPHCADMVYGETLYDDNTKNVWNAQVQQMSKWVGEFYSQKQKPWPKFNNVGTF